MRKLVCVILSAALIGCTSRQEPKQYANYWSSSGFTLENADGPDIENLVVLAKVWGFAKYHHPVFADSIYNIDYELFELLPKVAYAEKNERNALLDDWIKNLGSFRSVKQKYQKEIAERECILAADMKWLRNSELLGVELSETLQRLRYAHRPKPSRYACYDHRAGQADFSAESGNGSPFSDDTGYNLLTLFRLWNMAEYYFPSVNITDKKWTEVLPEYIPKFLYATDSIKWTTAELIAELSDTHSAMSGNPIYSDLKLPVRLGFVENKLIVTDNKTFLGTNEMPVFERGDEIVSIDGHTPDYFVERARRYIAASNENRLLHDAAELACFASNEKVSFVIERENKQMEFDVATITRRKYYNRLIKWRNDKKYYELLNDSIGYLYPGKFKNGDSAAIMAEFKDTKAVIIDFRCYPSGNMPFELTGGYFVPEKIQFAGITRPVVGLPGYYAKEEISLGDINNDYYKGKVVVLVNSETISSAEYQTIAFQAAPNTIVVGSQTAGADGNITLLSLPRGERGVKTCFSGLGIYYPDGTNIQRAGVRIDHYIEPTIEGVRTGRDEVLEKALEILESEYVNRRYVKNQ